MIVIHSSCLVSKALAFDPVIKHQEAVLRHFGSCCLRDLSLARNNWVIAEIAWVSWFENDSSWSFQSSWLNLLRSKLDCKSLSEFETCCAVLCCWRSSSSFCQFVWINCWIWFLKSSSFVCQLGQSGLGIGCCFGSCCHIFDLLSCVSFGCCQGSLCSSKCGSSCRLLAFGSCQLWLCFCIRCLGCCIVWRCSEGCCCFSGCTLLCGYIRISCCDRGLFGFDICSGCCDFCVSVCLRFICCCQSVGRRSHQCLSLLHFCWFCLGW